MMSLQRKSGYENMIFSHFSDVYSSEFCSPINYHLNFEKAQSLDSKMAASLKFSTIPKLRRQLHVNGSEADERNRMQLVGIKY